MRGSDTFTVDYVTTVGSATDNAVLRISTGYEVRGMPATVTSHNNATPGTGTALNQCALTYNTFSQLAEEQQDHGGGVSSSSPDVQYTYDSGASSSNEVCLSSLTYPNGRVITYSYGTSGGMNDRLNRIDTIQDTTSGTTSLASYTYLGLGTVVRITYPQANVWLDLWGGTSGVFNGLDLFSRVIDQRWQNSITGTPADIDRYQYGYDQDSNRLYKANVVGTPIVTGGLDEFYTYDHLNRLTEMQRGTLNSTKTGITGTPAREMDYTLDPTGNWPAYLTKTIGTTDLSQTRTSNSVNEITAMGGTPTWVTPAYDAAGNTTTFPQPAAPTSPYTALYDAWNRMTSISASSTTVARYQYDGRNRRIVKLTYSSGVLSETRHFYFTIVWQDIEERVGTSTSMDKQYVWGVRYIDELISRDDATPERLYACQDAIFNVSAMANIAGAIQQRFVYDPYGSGSVRNPSTWGMMGDGYGWTPRFTGHFYDAETEMYNCRARYYQPGVGRFLGRDPLGYADGPDTYQYARSRPTGLSDPYGLGPGPNRPQPGGVAPAPGFARCERSIRPTPGAGWWDNFLDGLGNSLFGGHQYVQTPNDVDALGNPIIGWEITNQRKGALPLAATLKKGETTKCGACERTAGQLRFGNGKGKSGLAASDADIASCIKSRGMPQDYNTVTYNCQDWARDTPADCGLSCTAPGDAPSQ